MDEADDPTLARKLGIQPGQRIYLVAAPPASAVIERSARRSATASSSGR